MKILIALFIIVYFPLSLHAEGGTNVLFFSGGSGQPDSGHNGRINHHQLIPKFLRAGIQMTYTSDMNQLNPNNLSQYDAVVLYREFGRGHLEQLDSLIDFVDKGGGLVALHNSCAGSHNHPKFIEFIGGQFDRHGKGWFTARHVKEQINHPILKKVPEFEVFDETYVHKNLSEDRTVLMVRDEKGRPEPWTWVRKHGKGRVFYSAYGHDLRVWENFDFQKLVTSATLWAAQKQEILDPRIPKLTYLADTNNWFHNYEKRRNQLIQQQLKPEESLNCMVLPDEFEIDLVAHEPDIMNPIDMTWDDRGRMLVAVTMDYPRIQKEGSDRVLLCEDKDGDGKADSFTTFAEGFSLITGICWVNGGLILAQAPDMFFVKDTNGDDQADLYEKINTGWGTNDTHGGPSNLRYGLDNKIYGCVGGGGYVSGQTRFSGGIWRMEVDGSGFTPISNFGGNSWGLGISEDFELFGCSANKNPAYHIHAPYPYFEALGLKKVKARRIFDFETHYPLTITRKYDHYGSYTSAAGFDLYTARSFPKSFWNRTAFVGSPTGKLLGQFHLEPDGKGSYRARNGGNFVASFDEYTAPIQGRTGPDGNLYMLDWNNLIMIHGGELDNPLRDKSHGRIYRISHKESKPDKVLNFKDAETKTLVAALQHPNMFWRLMAQRKLVQQKRIEAIPLLIELAQDGGVDDIGSNPGVIHALWTLHGLGQVTDSNAEALTVAEQAVRHRSAAVRKNAVRVLPKNTNSTKLLSGLLDEKDPNTLRQILLTLSSMPKDDLLGEKIYAIRDRIPTGEGLSSPYQLALIRHGSSLVERLISQLPSRNRAKEGKVEKKEVELVNMLKNPSFEESKDGLPVNWISKVHKGTATLSIDSSLARTGKNSGRIESKVGGGAEFLMVRSVEPGEYLLSAWVRTKDIEGKNGVLLKVQGRGLQSKESAKLKGTINEWQKLQINFRVDSQSGVLVFCLFGAWSEAKGTVWFDDVELFQLSSEKVIHEVTKVESLLAKQAFEKGPEEMIKLVELINTKEEKSSSIFMEGLNDLTDISLDAMQTRRLKALADDAAPANKMALAIFASNNQIDLGLTELANSLTGFEAEILTGNADRGKVLASSCISCHGNDFTGMVSERSPSLPQLSDWYMQSQMQKFKHNVRGYEVTDSDGTVMKALMQNYSHQQMADMVAYIRTFKPKEQAISLGGDPLKGKTHYQTCIACHQVDGKGNKLLNAPSLLGHSDLYVYNQLIKYRNGHRGNGSGDKAGKIMQMSSKLLPDDQAIKDLAAYLTTLK